MNIVLVHGSYHGPWCWERLTPELERRGHNVTAVDLPISDPEIGAAGYADALEAQVDWSEPPIIVAHSTGGLTVPIVAARRPVRRLVFLASMLPKPGMSTGEQRQVEPIDGPGPISPPQFTDLGDNVWMVGPTTATEMFFQDASPELAGWAVAQLRPQAYRAMDEITPLEAWPDVPSAYVVCREDRALNPEWARGAARERLGIEPLEIDGGHSPFLTRPAELAELLEPALR